MSRIVRHELQSVNSNTKQLEEMVEELGEQHRNLEKKIQQMLNLIQHNRPLSSEFMFFYNEQIIHKKYWKHYSQTHKNFTRGVYVISNLKNLIYNNLTWCNSANPEPTQ